MTEPLLLGIDVGGTGSRAALAGFEAGSGERVDVSGSGVALGADGTSLPAVVEELLDRVSRAWPERIGQVAAVGLGATGASSLLRDPSALVAAVRERLGAPVVLAADAVTAHLGALAGEGGAVVVLGTGAIAIGHPGPAAQPRAPWRRVDGWGHLLGDRGGGAWLGRHGLERALRTVDGLDPAGAALLAAARVRVGEAPDWPALIYPRPDRAGVLASFAQDVLDLSRAGDAAAVELARAAGQEAAASVIAALGAGLPRTVVLSGGLARTPSPLTVAFAERIRDRDAGIEVRTAAGTPLDGALHLARLAHAVRVAPQEGMLWA